jgi:hypothetical protein
MSTNKDLFKEAIADAKAVREAALANAKAALEEALTPKLQSMLAAKLNEMDYEEEGMGEEEMEEGFTSSHEENNDANLDFNLEEEMEDESMDEEFDLSEILAELEDDEMEEAIGKKLNKGGHIGSLKDKDEKTTLKTAQADTAYSKIAEAKEEGEEEETEEEVEVADMSREDLKALIKDIVSQEIEAEEEEMPAEEAGEEETVDMEIDNEENDELEEEIDLEELLAELDSLKENEETNEIYSDTGAALADDDFRKAVGAVISAFTIGGAITWLKDFKAKAKATPKVLQMAAQELVKKGADKQKVDAIISNKSPESPMEEAKKKMSKEKEVKVEKEVKNEMKEAIATINTLRSELNETNLLNAKLLYVNKIFKAKNLTESQKLKVIASFDKATNVKEAKVVFESLQSALTTAPKKALKESFGFASKAAGVAHKSTIVETSDAITRMQKLANIIK